MFVTDDETLARRAKHLTTQARLPGPEYYHDEVGYNYRMTNITAALGVAQLEQMPSFVARKRRITERYEQALAHLPGFSGFVPAATAEPSCWMHSVTIDPTEFGRDRTAVMHALRLCGIESRPLWTPLHRMPLNDDCAYAGGAVAESLFAAGLSLPSSVGLTDEAQDFVIEEIRKLAP